jgi:hypothetical protein
LANRPIIWKPLPGLPHIKIVIAFIANYRTSKHARFRVERCDGRHKLGFEYPIIFWTPRDVQSPDRLVQKIALTVVVDQADNSI